MSTLSTVAATEPAPVTRRVLGRLGDRLLHTYVWLVLAWLGTPIAVMILFITLIGTSPSA